MFGMGGTEILVILIVALLFLGPDKLPEAAKSISKGIRDLRKQTREFQDTIEADEKIGGAIRDLKSALNGEEPRKVRPPRPLPGATTPEAAAAAAAMITEGITTGTPPAEPLADDPPAAGTETAAAAATVTLPPAATAATATDSVGPVGQAAAEVVAAVVGPSVTLPPTAGERSPADSDSDDTDDNKDLAAMIRPAEGAIAKGTSNGHG